MKVSVLHIHKGSMEEPFEVEDTVDVSELETMNNDIRRIEPVHVNATFRVDKEEIIATLNIKGEMILPCARTLVDVPYPFDFTVDEIFSTSPYLTEDEIEEEIHPVEGEVIDLVPLIMENIILETPYRVFSEDPNPEGGAPMDGEGWSFIQEDEIEEKTIDPRLKKLESLLNNEEEKEDE